MTDLLIVPEKYLFIDETGDPFFYGNRKKLLVGTEGFQPYLIIGMIETDNRKVLRKTVVDFISDIEADNLYNSIPSITTGKGWFVHARGDHLKSEQNSLSFYAGYKAHIVIARKNLNIFSQKHNNNPTEFYFDVLHHLLNGRLKNSGNHYGIFLS